MLLNLAWKSLLSRQSTVALTIVSIAVSVALLLGVAQLQRSVRASFLQTVSGVDLIVGARGGSLNLLLYSVFRLGDATNNVTWKSYQHWDQHPQVDWTIPFSLGDSHRGYRVLGTTEAYFEHFRFGQQQALVFAEGRPFSALFDVVLGADVARRLKYQLGQEIVIAHGTGNAALLTHDDKPFKVVGILEPTGTPVDQTLHVSLEAISAIHIDWRQGVPPSAEASVSAEQVLRMKLEPESLTAFMVKLRSRMHTFRYQRAVNTYAEEPLLAILPGVALQQLWRVLGVAEQALLAVSGFVVLAGLTGMTSVLLTTLNERRREMAILRSVGARPHLIFSLLLSEAALLVCSGILLGVLLLYVGLWLVRPLIQSQLGLMIAVAPPSLSDGLLLGGVFVMGVLLSAIPAWQAYRNSLSDGLMPKL